MLVRLCAEHDAPKPGEVREAEAGGVAVCLANVDGTLKAVDNWCPHRRGSLGAGWLEGNAVVCPLHAWTFDLTTGLAQEPERAQIPVYALSVEDGQVFVELG